MSQYMAVFSVKRVADGGVGDPLLHAWVLARVQYLTAMLRKYALRVCCFLGRELTPSHACGL